jgi:peptidoglycan/LPS O-acetylase OafA/YrhL
MSSTDGGAGFTAYLGQRRFGALDGLRCASIIAVIWHHTTGPWQIDILNRGFLGVDLFFVISGYLIVTLLLRERRTTGGIGLRRFYARRALRILPPCYLLLGGVAALYLTFKRHDPNTALFFSLLPAYVFYVSNWLTANAANFSILWSLAAEEQFYVLWPPVEKWLAGKALWIALGLAIAVNQLANFGWLDPFFVWLYGSPKGAGLSILDTTFTPILLGVGLAHLLDSPAGFAAAARFAGFWLSAAIFLAALLAAMAVPNADISGAHRLVIQCLMAALVCGAVMREDHALMPLLSAAAPVFIGSISYGMYLYHMWMAHLARVLLGKIGLLSSLTLFPLALAFSIAAAWASFRFFESHFLSWKTRFAAAPVSPR